MLLPVIVALVMLVLANNLVAAFGLMAVFAIVRFRNVLRDTLDLDTVHVLVGIAAGMACGTRKFATAVLGGLLVAAVIALPGGSDLRPGEQVDVMMDRRSMPQP